MGHQFARKRHYTASLPIESKESASIHNFVCFLSMLYTIHLLLVSRVCC
jgi:hypothetical protein